MVMGHFSGPEACHSFISFKFPRFFNSRRFSFFVGDRVVTKSVGSSIFLRLIQVPRTLQALHILAPLLLAPRML